MTADRSTALAERAASIERLRNMPAAMRDKPQWLLWKLELIEGRDGLQKVPYYVSGRRRHLDAKAKTPAEIQAAIAADRKALATFDAVLARFKGAMHFHGVGFAFLDGDGLIGIDLDKMIDLDSGEMREHFRPIVEACASYTERSPSRKGVHIIVEGHTDSFKHDPVGIEVYCGGRYFTCTGDHYSGTPTEVQPIKPYALAYLRELVDKSKEAAKQAKAAAAAASTDPGTEATREHRVHTPAPGQKGNDFRLVNEAAYRSLRSWVPEVFPAAREWHGGYRITSKALGRNLQEDLQLLPEGIMDFGEEQGMSPIDVVMKWVPGLSKASEALHWLAPRVGVPLEKQRLRLVPPPPAGTKAPAGAPDQAPAALGDERPESPPSPDSGDAPAKGGKGSAKKKASKPAAAKAEGDGGGADDDSPIDWEKFKALRRDFALIYGTDTVWDGENRLIMKIANMAHAHGSTMVKLWKGGQQTRRHSEPGRWTVLPANVVFDPAATCDTDTHINLFGGFPTKAKEGDVGPILELVTYLTSRAAEDPDECDAIKHYLLCWLAYPLQRKGAKLRTAVIMHGDEGAGKNFLTDILVKIYGEYGATVGQDELEDKFNDWRSRKLFVVGDEVSSRAELVHNKNRLKALITSTAVQINPKNLPRREEANHINVWFNSNELQPLALDNSDRRYLVIYTPKAREFEFYQRLGEWERKGGMEALYHYLLNYEMTGFEPYAPAPMTVAKSNLVDLNRKSPERFWIEWSEGQLDLPYRSCSIPQAYQAYLKYAQRTGDRFPIQRALFTSMVLRISDTMGRPVIDKVMKVDYALKGSRLEDQRATRMFLVLKPPDGVALGAWASECYHEFEVELKRYLGVGFRDGASSSSTDDGDKRPEPPP